MFIAMGGSKLCLLRWGSIVFIVMGVNCVYCEGGKLCLFYRWVKILELTQVITFSPVTNDGLLIFI